MSENRVSIIETRETIYFSYVDGQLRQWIVVTGESRLNGPVSTLATIEAGDSVAETRLELTPGVREYRCYAPALWPDHPPVRDAALQLELTDGVVTHTTSVGHHRPWTIYLLSDGCTDYTWVYDNVEAEHSDDAEVTEAELALAEATRGGLLADQNHYNLVHAREVEFYLEHYPEHADRLFEHIRLGNITLNPIYNMCLTCAMSLEELIRQLYPARGWAREQGLDIGYANHQETPTIAWAMVPVLAGSGVEHLVKSILPYECPWAERLEEPPVFVWEGPDGSQLLVRWRNGDYVEGRFVLRGLRATISALHDEIIPRYEGMGADYPFDAVALVGCYGDLAPTTSGLPAKKVATVTAYNAQEWDYPKLVNASHKQFWDDVQRQITARSICVPVVCGDFGTSWDAWPASLAYDFAGWRRAQERSGLADKLAAVLSLLDEEWYEAHRDRLAQGWMNLLYLADHAWNGANDANRALNARLRREWQLTSNRAFDEVIEDGLGVLAKRVPVVGGKHVLVFNGLGWTRHGVVRVAGIEGNPKVHDATTGELVASQAVVEDGDSVLCFEAPAVPSVGYRVFSLGEEKSDLARGPWQAGGCRLEGPFYAVEVSPITGGITSLRDKLRGRELVNRGSPYHLNQALYLSEEVEHTPRSASVRLGSCGPVFAELIVSAELKNTQVTTTITLYSHIDRVDVRNEVEKIPSSERQEFDFAFPFLVPDGRFRFEAPGVILAPEADMRPGAGQAVNAVRHFVDVSSDEYGVTLSQADSGLVEFGHRTTAEDPLAPDTSGSTVLALAMENNIDWHEAIRDQAGASSFVFRFSLRGHSGGFDPVNAVRFGWEDNNELVAIALDGEKSGDLPPGSHSFLSVEPDNVVLTGVKVAEERGLIVRLWECSGHNAEAAVNPTGLGALRAASQTDLLETDTEALAVGQGGTRISVPARGIMSARLVLSKD